MDGCPYKCQSPVPAHAVPENANSIAVQLFELREEGFGEFFRYVAVHLVPFTPWLLRCVYVEACAGAEVVGLVLALDFETACRTNKDQPG